MEGVLYIIAQKSFAKVLWFLRFAFLSNPKIGSSHSATASRSSGRRRPQARTKWRLQRYGLLEKKQNKILFLKDLMTSFVAHDVRMLWREKKPASSKNPRITPPDIHHANLQFYKNSNSISQLLRGAKQSFFFMHMFMIPYTLVGLYHFGIILDLMSAEPSFWGPKTAAVGSVLNVTWCH